MRKIVKEYVADVWKYESINYNYDNDSGPGQLNSKTSPRDLTGVEGQRDSKFG